MTYKELTAMMNALTPEQLGPKNEQVYRWHHLILMAEITASLDQISYAYRRMLEIQERREAGQQPPPKTGKAGAK